jgi:two-component system NtrC family sensor kinase
LCGELLHAIRQQHAFRQVRFDFAADPANHQLNADVTQLNSLFSYLIRNAADAVQDDKDDAVVEVSLRYDDRHDALEFAVRDSSRRKLTPVELRHMFDPFFSGHSAGRGLGFGLSLAWQIVRQHRGVIFCCAPDAGGLQSYVALPVETD